MLSTDENGRRFTVQYFYEGTTYPYNEAPCNIQKESAILLAKIHEAIEALINYITDYMKVGSLNTYDIENAGNLFYYFLEIPI